MQKTNKYFKDKKLNFEPKKTRKKITAFNFLIPVSLCICLSAENSPESNSQSINTLKFFALMLDWCRNKKN